MPVVGFNSGKYDLQLIRKYFITHLSEENVSSGEKSWVESSFWMSQTICHQTDKLDYKGLPPYWCWYSQLKNEFALTPKEYDECKRVFQERGMKTFGDWLEYYNNLYLTPFLETLEKM